MRGKVSFIPQLLKMTWAFGKTRKKLKELSQEISGTYMLLCFSDLNVATYKVIYIYCRGL